MKFPDQFIAVEKTDGNPVDPFWDRFIRTVQGSPDGPNPSAAFFHLQSPYMHRSAVSTVSFLRTAVERGYSPELYAYLDGVHLGHSRQSPAEFENVGEALTEISRRSAEKKQHHLYLCCSRCAVARGYGALDDEKGNYFSFCTIPPFMIRNLDQIVARFKDHHVIASHSAFSICDREFRTASPEIKRRVKRNTPSLNIVITHDPYGTEMTFGALSFAIACAFRDIRTRVIFIEDGIQCLTGTHSTCDDEVTLNIQDIIQAATETQNLELYTYIPSFQLRGVTKNNSFTGVLPIGSQDLARLILVPPKGSASRHRVILF
jgi:tRNA 2-thiouridine synthesizing protein C